MNKLLITIAGCLLFSELAAAAHGMGNGGNVLVCYSDQAKSNIQSLQFFDHWEKATQYGQSINLGPDSLSVNEKIALATDRIAQFDPALAGSIKKVALSLSSNLSFYLVKDYEIPVVNDFTPQVAIPANCEVKQLAVQQKNIDTGEKRYVISDFFFNHPMMTNNDRAGLLLHEAIYRQSIVKFNATNSDTVREFNYQISTERFANFKSENLPQYVEILKAAGLYDENCQFDIGFYVKSYRTDIPTEKMWCFKQTYKKGNLQIDIDQFNLGGYHGDELHIYMDVTNNHPVKLSVYDQGQYKKFEAYNVHFKLNGSSVVFIELAKTPAPLGSLQMQVVDQLIKCDNSFSYDLNSNEVITCRSDDLSGGWIAQAEKLFDATTPAKWRILAVNSSKESKTLKIYKSKYNQSVTISKIDDPKRYLITAITLDVTDQSEVTRLVNSTVRPEKYTIKLSGFEYQFARSFSIDESVTGTKMTLNTSYNDVLNPKFNNQEYSATSVGNVTETDSFLCQQYGYNNGAFLIEAPLVTIGPVGKTFVDARTGEAQYRADEDIRVVQHVQCNPTQITSSDF